MKRSSTQKRSFPAASIACAVGLLLDQLLLLRGHIVEEEVGARDEQLAQLAATLRFRRPSLDPGQQHRAGCAAADVG